MRIKKLPLILSFLCISSATFGSGLYNENNLRNEHYQNKVGGRLVCLTGDTVKSIYDYEKEIEYIVSPDESKVAITDKAGTAAFSVLIVGEDLTVRMIDNAIYRLKPELKNYTSVYPTVVKWSSSNSVLVSVEAYGPIEQGIPNTISFQVEVPLGETH